MSMIAADSNEAFAEQVLAASEPVVVDFWAPWCGPCRMVGPEVEALAEQYAGRIRFAKVNVDEVPELSARYQIQGIPMIGLFKDGEMVRSIVGARPRHAIEADLGLKYFAPTSPAGAGEPKASAPAGDEARPATAPSARPDGPY
jgi:thioredoxin 1